MTLSWRNTSYIKIPGITAGHFVVAIENSAGAFLELNFLFFEQWKHVFWENFLKSFVDFFMENKTFLNQISHSVCMQRYNSVIECKSAKKCYLEIGDKLIFSTHGQNFRGRV